MTSSRHLCGSTFDLPDVAGALFRPGSRTSRTSISRHRAGSWGIAGACAIRAPDEHLRLPAIRLFFRRRCFVRHRNRWRHRRRRSKHGIALLRVTTKRWTAWNLQPLADSLCCRVWPWRPGSEEMSASGADGCCKRAGLIPSGGHCLYSALPFSTHPDSGRKRYGPWPARIPGRCALLRQAAAAPRVTRPVGGPVPATENTGGSSRRRPWAARGDRRSDGRRVSWRPVCPQAGAGRRLPGSRRPLP